MFRVITPTGDYPARNRAANAAKTDLYLDFHFNAGPSVANYCMTMFLTKSSASIAGALSRSMASVVGLRDMGAKVATRGRVCIAACAMPAVILEPLFVSNPAGAAWVKNPGNLDRLADAIAATVKSYYPNGGTIAISTGHIGKTSSPNDRGAPVFGGGTEAEYAAMLAAKVASRLSTTSPPANPPTTLKPSMPLLMKGSKGSAVRVLQSALAKRGYRIAVDGDFGPKTQWAVRTFQLRNRLVPDGKVGPRTWKALGAM